MQRPRMKPRFKNYDLFSISSFGLEFPCSGKKAVASHTGILIFGAVGEGGGGAEPLTKKLSHFTSANKVLEKTLFVEDYYSRSGPSG